MSIVNAIANLSGMFYMNQKTNQSIQNIKVESGLKDRDWAAFLDEKSSYPVEVQTVVEVPNEEHVKLYDKDLEDINRIQEETRQKIEREIPECLSNIQFLDGSINFHQQNMTEVLASANGRTGIDENDLSTKLCYAESYLYGATSNSDIQADAQGVFNNFLTLREETEKNVRISQKGKTGEDYVGRVLKQYRDRFFYLENVVIPSYEEQGKTSETDVYIISSKGIFVCEVKNYGSSGQIILMPETGDWKMVDESGRFIANKPSAFVQNERHCNATRSFIREHLDIEVPIIPVIIIANNEVEIQNENPNANIVIRAEQIGELVSSFQDTIDYETQKRIVAAFEEHQLDANDFPVKINADRARYLQEVVKEYIPYMRANAKIANIYMNAIKTNRMIAWGITLLLALISMIPVLMEGEWLIIAYGVIAWFVSVITESKIGTICGIVSVILLPMWLILGAPAMGGISLLCTGVNCYVTFAKDK